MRWGQGRGACSPSRPRGAAPLPTFRAEMIEVAKSPDDSIFIIAEDDASFVADFHERFQATTVRLNLDSVTSTRGWELYEKIKSLNLKPLPGVGKVRRGAVGASPHTSSFHAHAAFDPARQVMATDGNRLV